MELNCFCLFGLVSGCLFGFVFVLFVSHISTGKTPRGKSLPYFIRYLYSDKGNRILIFVGLTPITMVQTRMIALCHGRHIATKPSILWELFEE